MVNKQVISSPLFAKRRKLSPTLMRTLLIRGGGINVDDCLRRFGWDGIGATITTVMNINVEAGTVSGVRFESRGQGPNVTFRAKDLWRTAEDGISVTLKLHDLSELEWNSEGRVRNQTKWLDSSNLNVSVFKGEDRLDTQREKEDAGVGGLSV